MTDSERVPLIKESDSSVFSPERPASAKPSAFSPETLRRGKDDSGLIEMQDFDSAVAGISVSDLFETYCPVPAKDLWKEHSKSILPKVGKAKALFAEHVKGIQIVYGALCLVYGGSFPFIALILAFISVIDTSGIRRDFQALSQTDHLTPESAAESAAKLAKFFVLVYSAWLSPFIAAVIIAVSIEPYVTESLESSAAVWGSLFKRLELAGMTMSKAWFRFAFTQVNRLVLSLLGHFLFPRIFASIFMGLYGMTLMATMAGQKVQDTLNSQKNIGPVNLKIIILWGVTLLFTLWQALNGFDASFIKYLIPIGFLATMKSDGAISPAFWKIAPAKEQ